MRRGEGIFFALNLIKDFKN